MSSSRNSFSSDGNSSAAMDSGSSSSDVKNASGYTYYEMVFEALSAISYENGVDFDGIFNFIKERHEVPPKFRKRLRDKLKKLVSQNKLAKVENRYKILDGTTAEASNPTQMVNPEDSSKAQELPSSELLSISEADAVAEIIALAEHREFEAKEASELSDKFNQLLKESDTVLEFSMEVLELCTKGEKVVLR